MIPSIFRPRFNPKQIPEVPMDLPDDVYARFSEMVRRWKSIFNHDAEYYDQFVFMYPSSAPADFEDWSENAALLFPLIDSGRPVFVVATAHIETKETSWGARFPINSENNHAGQLVTTINTTEKSIPAKSEPVMIFGASCKSDGGNAPGFWPKADAIIETFVHNAETDPVSAYWKNPAFKQFAGRAIDIGTPEDMATNEYPNVRQLITNRVKEHGEFVAKVLTSHKTFPLYFSEHLPPEKWTEKRLSHAMMEAFDYELEHHSPYVLVSEYIRITSEYRIFFVDGKPVCGAGCIEEYSPPWNSGEAFDPKVEQKRNHSDITSKPDLVASYVEFATKALDEFRKHDPKFLHGVIDIATMTRRDGTTNIGIIEINSARNAGQYALRTDLFVKTLTEFLDKEKTEASTQKEPG